MLGASRFKLVIGVQLTPKVKQTCTSAADLCPGNQACTLQEANSRSGLLDVATLGNKCLVK